MSIPFELGSALVPHILELVKDATLINHTLCIDQFHCSAQTSTSVTDDSLEPIVGLGPSLDQEAVAALPTLHASRSRPSANPQFLVFLSHSLDCNPNATKITLF